MPDATSCANSTVHVGCKLPNGIYLELIPEATPGVFTPPPAGQRILIKGSNTLRNDYTIRGLSQQQYGFAVSEVPSEVWAEWLKRNSQTPLVKNGFIFAVSKQKDAIAEGKERESERTGLEPLNPTIELDPRIRVRRDARPEQRVTADTERLSELNRLNAGEPRYGS